MREPDFSVDEFYFFGMDAIECTFKNHRIELGARYFAFALIGNTIWKTRTTIDRILVVVTQTW